MEESDRALRASFAAAANQLTQLYRTSLQQQRIAYDEGAKRALERVAEHLSSKSKNGNDTISAAEFLVFINSEISKIDADNPVAPSTSSSSTSSALVPPSSSAKNPTTPTRNSSNLSTSSGPAGPFHFGSMSRSLPGVAQSPNRTSSSRSSVAPAASNSTTQQPPDHKRSIDSLFLDFAFYDAGSVSVPKKVRQTSED